MRELLEGETLTRFRSFQTRVRIQELVNRRRAIKLIGVATGGLLAAPALSTPKKIKVGALRLTTHSGSFVALERGHFAELGLDVELVFFQSASSVACAVAKGTIDFAVSAITGAMLSQAAVGKIKLIGGVLSEEPGIEGQKVLVSNATYNSGVKSLDALHKRTFAVTHIGSSFHFVGSRLAELKSLKLSFLPLRELRIIEGAMRGGSIEAWSMIPSVAQALLASGVARSIGSVADILPDYQVTVLFTSPREIENDVGRTKAFIRAFSVGIRDYTNALIEHREEKEEIVDIIRQYVYPGQPKERASKNIETSAMRLNLNATLNLKSVEEQLSWLRRERLVSPDLTMDELIASSVVNSSSEPVHKLEPIKHENASQLRKTYEVPSELRRELPKIT